MGFITIRTTEWNNDFHEKWNWCGLQTGNKQLMIKDWSNNEVCSSGLQNEFANPEWYKVNTFEPHYIYLACCLCGPPSAVMANL